MTAAKGQLGIIPGSMGARSYIVRGKGNPESFESSLIAQLDRLIEERLGHHLAAQAGLDVQLAGERPLGVRMRFVADTAWTRIAR